jgi:hypothetical protein
MPLPAFFVRSHLEEKRRKEEEEGKKRKKEKEGKREEGHYCRLEQFGV